MITVATVDDLPAFVALANAVHDDRLITLAGARHRFTSAPPGARQVWWKAERVGGVVGWGFAGYEPYAAAEGRATGEVIVHPDHRDQGVGSALWEHLDAHWADLGAHHVVVESRSDAASRAFVERRGFALTSTSEMLELDPRALQPPAPVSDGLELMACAVYADDPRPLYEVDYATAQDEPSDRDYGGLTFELWRSMLFDHPEFDAEISLAAHVDGAPVGASFLYVDHSTGRALSGGTGVLRSYRNRGIATQLKRHSLARAARAGLSRVIAQNDATNTPMLAINRRLGYRPLSTRLGWTRTR